MLYVIAGRFKNELSLVSYQIYPSNSYFQPRNMYHTLPTPSLSFSGQFNVLLFFLGEKDEFTMTRPGKGKETKKLKTYCLC